jgi:hypothetical protein
MDAEKRWLSIDGPEFIAKIGISAGHTVVDFGCGDGYYTFPAARIVKDEGLLSVYPKHYKSDSPMWSLADMSLKNIIKEITEMGFRFENKRYEKLFHFNSYSSGYILSFKKILSGNPGTAISSREIQTE